MNYSYAPAPNARPLTSGVSGTGNFSARAMSFLNSYWAILLVILIVFVVMVIYYKTIGYYLDFGWKRIRGMIGAGDSVTAELGEHEEGEGGASATLKPMDEPPKPAMLPPGERPIGMPGAAPADSPFLSALGSIAEPRKEVFNVSRNIYTYNDASAVCSAYNADLASYEQVQQAYEKGADWCNYGWVKGQMAVYPTQKATWDKLQKGDPEYRSACGKPGINGGFFDNPELRFGVNCYGKRPPKSGNDELLESQVALPPSTAEIEYDKKVQKFREQMDTNTILPFQRGRWGE